MLQLKETSDPLFKITYLFQQMRKLKSVEVIDFLKIIYPAEDEPQRVTVLQETIVLMSEGPNVSWP